MGDTITNKGAYKRRTPETRGRQRGVRRIASVATPARILPLLLALGILVFLYFHAAHFFSQRNILNILVQMSSLALMAIGMTFVMVGGGIDLSMPATMAFSAVLGAFLMRAGYNPALANLATLLAAGAIGLLNGAAVAAFRMTPFVVTLASMTAVGGATVWMTNSVSVSNFPDAFFDFYLARPFGVPVIGDHPGGGHGRLPRSRCRPPSSAAGSTRSESTRAPRGSPASRRSACCSRPISCPRCSPD